MMLLQSFEAQVKAAEQKKTFEDIEVEGELLLSISTFQHGNMKSPHCAQNKQILEVPKVTFCPSSTANVLDTSSINRGLSTPLPSFVSSLCSG